MALIGGETHIKNISLTAPKILLEKDSLGAANWDDFLTASGGEADTGGDSSEAAPITLEKVQITNASIRFIDPNGATIEVPNLTADFTWGEGAASLVADVSLMLLIFFPCEAMPRLYLNSSRLYRRWRLLNLYFVQ